MLPGGVESAVTRLRCTAQRYAGCIFKFDKYNNNDERTESAFEARCPLEPSSF